MALSVIVFIRKEYDLIAKSRGITEPQKMSTEELLNALSRYDSKCKVKSNHKELNKINLKKLLKYKIFQKII